MQSERYSAAKLSQLVHQLTADRKNQNGATCTKVQADSLVRFVEDWLIANLDPRKNSAEMKRVVEIQKMLGPTIFEFMVRSIGQCNGLEDTEKTCKIPARSGKILLRVASEHLVPFYGLK